MNAVTTHFTPGWGAAPHRSAKQGAAKPRSEVLATWAIAMVPGTLLSMVAAFFVGNALMSVTGTPEGRLLTSRGIAGMAAWVFVNLVALSAPIAGICLALLARRRGGSPRATTALVINSGIVVYLALAAVANLLLS